MNYLDDYKKLKTFAEKHNLSVKQDFDMSGAYCLGTKERNTFGGAFEKTDIKICYFEEGGEFSFTLTGHKMNESKFVRALIDIVNNSINYLTFEGNV
tara:strand:+ start:1158 stop:1448 length:291 start_codon:yes stop_codon:yes gene_type:complete